MLGIGATTLCAISCHLASKKPMMRLAQFRELCKVLGAKLGNPFFQITEQFHHVVWMGDLNYRCSDIAAEDALACIRNGGVGSGSVRCVAVSPVWVGGLAACTNREGIGVGSVRPHPLPCL